MYNCLLLILSFFVYQNSDTFKDDVENYLKQNLKKYDRFEFEILQAPDKSNKIIINNDKQLTVNSGFANINVTVIDKKNKVTQSYITLKIKLYQTVAVAVTDMRVKEEITADKLELKQLEVTMLKSEPLTKIEEAAGYVARTRINKGRIISTDIVEAAPVIKSGDRVNANSVRGNVVVTTDAVAKQDGKVGEIIRIMTKENKQFKGKVVDSNNVIIVE